jgi:hypothetical protein
VLDQRRYRTRGGTFSPVGQRLSGGKLVPWGGLFGDWDNLNTPEKRKYLRRFSGLARVFTPDIEGARVKFIEGSKVGKWVTRRRRPKYRSRWVARLPAYFVRLLHVGDWLYAYVDVCAYIRPFPPFKR